MSAGLDHDTNLLQGRETGIQAQDSQNFGFGQIQRIGLESQQAERLDFAYGAQGQAGADHQFELGVECARVNAQLEAEEALELEHFGNGKLAFGLDDYVVADRTERAVDLRRAARYIYIVAANFRNSENVQGIRVSTVRLYHVSGNTIGNFPTAVFIDIADINLVTKRDTIANESLVQVIRELAIVQLCSGSL